MTVIDGHDHVLPSMWRARGHDILNKVHSAALPTSKDTGMGRRLFVKVTRKFNGHNLRKMRSNISGQECLTSFFLS